MVRLSEEDLEQLLVSDFDARIGMNSDSSDGSSSILKSMIDTCDIINATASEISTGGQFSVVSSLPGVSSAASSASSSLSHALVTLLKFSTGEDAFVSDLKDWSFIEDSLDSVFARIDEALAADSGPAKRQRLSTPEASDAAMGEQKPQSQWAELIDNYRPSFIPRIHEKLNAIEPLDPLLVELQKNPSKRPAAIVDFGNVYDAEIRASLREVCQSITTRDSLDDVTDFADIRATELVFVNTEDGLDRMIEEIISCGEVAIDLEHHDIHSFRGFTSLVQLSTREKDYIVDPFPLFRSLHKLNKFTTDPAIKKTFHGADMDIQWLQRDFGVYVVNMFDTGQAARVLGLAGGFGLANLLDTFCKVKANKRFQTSDWRTRPIPKDMLEYARADTHYLLYIRDRLEHLLLGLGSGTAGLVTVYGKKMLTQVMEKSAQVAAKVYRDSACDYDSDSMTQLCLKSPAMKVGQLRSSPKGMAVLRAALRWRDSTARRLDESKNYVLSNATCLRLAHAVPLTVPQVLRSVSQETSSLYPSMRIGSEEADEILASITEELEKLTMETGKDKMETISEPKSLEIETTSRRVSSGSVVHVGEFGTLKRTSRERLSGVSMIDNSEIVSQPSALFTFLQSAGMDQDMSSVHLEVIAELQRAFTECPEELQSALELLKANKEEETKEEEPENEPETVAFSTEFVSFSNKREPVQVDAEGLPLTLREQRKRAPVTESAQSSGPKKKQRNSKAGSNSAAVKALEFIEEELSLAKR